MRTPEELNIHARSVTADVLQNFLPLACTHDSEITEWRKKQKAERYCNNFCRAMIHDPFASEQDAINAIAPAAVWIFGWAARKFAILVIKALWRRWHES